MAICSRPQSKHGKPQGVAPSSSMASQAGCRDVLSRMARRWQTHLEATVRGTGAREAVDKWLQQMVILAGTLEEGSTKG